MGTSDRDSDGQPANARFNIARRSGRDMDELLGLCRGLAADGRVNHAEAQFLSEWLKLSGSVRYEWPGDILFHRVERMLEDGALDQSEEGELLELLRKATGGDPAKLNARSLTAGLPLTDPAPELVFKEKQYCFTGKLLLGPRSHCENEVLVRGGLARDSVTGDLDYLVVGVVGSRDWIHSSFGRKIEKAVELQKTGSIIAVVSEKHFALALR